ncbi:MAG: hypothetical protein K2H76_11060 [Muribaculaceae bacterium]|nr:hypothetical protein [Muribaculaceae bacterium]
MVSLFNAIWRFIHTGGNVFSEAAHGEYSSSSPYIEQLRKDLEESSEKSGSAIDRENMRGDNFRIRQDVGRAFAQYKMTHGYE